MRDMLLASCAQKFEGTELVACACGGGAVDMGSSPSIKRVNMIIDREGINPNKDHGVIRGLQQAARK